MILLWMINLHGLQTGNRSPFKSNLGGQENIYVMDLDGSNVKRLTYSTGSNNFPAWSADGTHIVFISSRDESDLATCKYLCNDEIYVMDSDGSNVKRLTNTPGIKSSPVWQP